MRRVTAPDVMPRRVLMTADAVGGIWSYSLELARGLVLSGYKVMLAVCGPSPTPEQKSASVTIGAEIVHRSYALEWMPEAERDTDAAAAWLREVAKRFRPDVVHLNGFAHAVLPWQVPTVVVAHSCVLSWWRAVRGEAAPAAWDAYRRRTLAGLRAADLVVAPTRAFLDEVQALYGPLARTRWIWNGRDPGPVPATEKEPLIFSAGRVWDEAKNLEALAAIADRLPWPVCVAGAGAPERTAGPTRPGPVRWLGEIPPETMQQWYGRASIFVLPSRYEPFGLAALEAALAGCALVLADIPPLRELWDAAALFVPPSDNEALASALDRIAGDPKLLWLLAGRARCRAAQYSASRMTAGYLEAYTGLLTSQHRTAAAAHAG
jgi:glycogen(starch) synthase